MAWLFLGLAALLCAALAPAGTPWRLAAGGLAAAGFAAAFWVYPAPRVLLVALGAGAAASLARAAAPGLGGSRGAAMLVAAGGACVLFALLGPAEGLF
jgi:hypothetical protein